MQQHQNFIHILLAAYNGEKYLSTQIESILNQTYTNWKLTIRDDNSTDNTPAVIERYAQRYPDKIFFIKHNDSNSGSVLNFSALLSAALSAPYMMFCDQDDKWLPNKIEITLSKMMELENRFGSMHPVLVFTDFLYTNEHLQPIASKQKFHVTKIKNVRIAHLFAQNHIYGCTMMINNALAIAADPIPAEAENHDYWVAMVAAAFGSVCYIELKTVLYRQHNYNVSGNYDNDTFKKRFQRIFVQRKNFKDAVAKYDMMLAFKTRYDMRLNAELNNILNSFIKFYYSKSIRIILKNIKNGVRSQTLIQTILIYTTILFLKKKRKLVNE